MPSTTLANWCIDFHRGCLRCCGHFGAGWFVQGSDHHVLPIHVDRTGAFALWMPNVCCGVQMASKWCPVIPDLIDQLRYDEKNQLLADAAAVVARRLKKHIKLLKVYMLYIHIYIYTVYI